MVKLRKNGFYQVTESKQGTRKNCQLTDQGYNKILEILKTENRFAEAQGDKIYKTNGEVNISKLSTRLEGLDRETITKIINRKSVSESSLKNFVTRSRNNHLSDEINEDDYELIEGEDHDYILCSKKTSSSIIPSPQEQLKRGLFDLNYKPQVRFFEDKISNLTTGSFLIYGDMNHGQQWLVNRLSYNIPYHDSAFREPIKLRRNHLKNGKLWQDLAKKLNTTYNNSLDNLAQSIYKQAQISTVILCFHDINILPPEDLPKLLEFCNFVTQNNQKFKHKIIIFLTSYEPELEPIIINDYDNLFNTLALERFQRKEVESWVTTHLQLFKDEQTSDADLEHIIEDIIGHYNEKPIEVLTRITQYCNLDWKDIEGTFSL